MAPNRSRRPVRRAGAGIALAGLLAACSSTQAATTTTSAAIPATTAPAASTTSTTGTTSTTLGAKPAGYDGPYPWQAQARLDDDGSPDSSWMTEAANVDAQDRANPSARLVFLGDSITAGWEDSGSATWEAFWVPRDPIDLGIVSDTTQNVLWRIQNGALAGLDPRAVVLLIGTNDIGQGWTPAQVAQGILACAEAVRTALPTAAIVLLSVFPRDTATSTANVAVEATNAALAGDQLPADTQLVNMGPTLSTPEGGPIPSLFANDLLHPNSAGYQVIAGRLMAVPVLADTPATTGSTGTGSG